MNSHAAAASSQKPARMAKIVGQSQFLRRIGVKAGLRMAPEARKRIKEAADGLDDVIRAIRDLVFNQQYPMS